MADLEDVPVLPTEDDYDTSNPVEVNKARKKSSRTRADRLKFVEAAMTMPQGRAWFYDLINFCHVFNTTFDEDPYRHAFRTGEANIGLRILSDIQETSPQNYVLMVSENKSKKE